MAHNKLYNISCRQAEYRLFIWSK